MTQLSIMIALLFALALGNATRSGVNPSPQSQLSGTYSEKASLQGRSGTYSEKASLQGRKVEPPQALSGGGDTGWPGF